MAYPTLKRTATQGYASNTFFDATLPTHTDVTDGYLIMIVSSRIAADHSIIANSTGWTLLTQIQRTSGAVGTTSLWRRYITGSSVSSPRFSHASGSSTLWWATCIVTDLTNTFNSANAGSSLGTATSSAAQATNATTPDSVDALVFGVFADSRTTTLSGTPTSPAVEYVDTWNGTYDNWHWVGYKQVASPALTSVTVTPSTTASMRELWFVITGYATNTAPTFSIQPSFATGRTHAFGTLSAIPDIGQGAGNGGTISFRATDAEQTGANELSYEIRNSATPGAGTLVASGVCTSGTTVNVAVTNSTSGLNTNGDKSLYVHVSDGTSTTTSNLLTVRVDESSPSAATSISTDPATVNDYERYRVIFTPNDTTSPDSGDLRYEIRTGTNGTGTQLTQGNATNAVEVTTAFFNDTALALGSNTRYIRVQDAGGNITQTSFTVTKANTRAWDQITTLATGTDDGYFTQSGTASFQTTATFGIVGWGAASIPYAAWTRFVLNAEPTYNIDYAMVRAAIQGVFAGPITVRIRGVLQLNPSAPADITAARALPLTTSSVTFSSASLDVDGEPFETPDLSAILEEIMAQTGWTSGNAIMLIWDTTTSYVNTTYQIRFDSIENTDTTPRFYVEWTAEVIYDEVTSTASTLHSYEGSSVEGILIDAAGGDHVIMGSFEGGTDGMVWFDTDTVSVIYASTTGVNTATQDDLAAAASVVYVSTSSTVLALQMVEEGQEGVIEAFIGGSDAGTFIETDDLVEAIVEAHSTLEDHDMNEPSTVSVVYVYTSGFDQVEGELDESNPVIIYVETMGEDAFDLGPQVYDEETIDVTVVIFPQLSGEEIATMYDLLEVDVWHALVDYSIEFFQGRFEEFEDPVQIPTVTSGADTMVMNASLDIVDILPVSTTSTVDTQSMFEPTGTILIGSFEGGTDTYVHGETGNPVVIYVNVSGQELGGFTELTGSVIIPIQTLGDEGMIMNETDGLTLIDTLTSGYEGNLVEDFGNTDLIAYAVTSSDVEVYLIRVPSTYFRSSLIGVQPYHGTMKYYNPYFRSSLVSINPMRESVMVSRV